MSFFDLIRTRNSHLCSAGPFVLNPFECMLLMPDVSMDDCRVAGMSTNMLRVIMRALTAKHAPRVEHLQCCV